MNVKTFVSGFNATAKKTTRGALKKTKRGDLKTTKQEDFFCGLFVSQVAILLVSKVMK